MTQIVVAINIHRPIGAVFDYVTTPANWPAWHPASRAVSGSVARAAGMEAAYGK
jgi:uncharacterized protein YndB with AHSA1/START domain